MFNTISDNSINSNYVGIWLNESWNNTLSNNNCSNSYVGVFLYSSNNNTLISNTFVNNGLLVGYSYDNIVEDNTINGKPICYFEDLSDATVTDDVGQVILVNCNNITVEGQDISYASAGIELWETDNSTILNNIASDNYRIGILIVGSNNIVKDNTASNNFWGIAVLGEEPANDVVSVNNIIENNTANNNTMEDYQGQGPSPCGIRLDASHNIVRENRVSGNFIGIGVGSGPDGDILTNNTMSCNHATNNIYGVVLINSSYSVVENNTASNNSHKGIYLSSSSNGTITNNTVKFNNDCGINLWNSSNNTLTANTANSNNRSGFRICESERNIISNNLALSNSWGILLQYCNNSIIVSNNASFNKGDVKGDGINLGFSNNNTVSNNEASGNIDAGIQVMNSSNNNTITNNTADLNNYCGINVWNSNNNLIMSNKASKNYNGIGLYHSVGNNISNNNFTNNDMYPEVPPIPFDNIIQDYAIEFDQNIGIFAYHSSDNIIFDNKVSFNGYTNIKLDLSNNNIISNNDIQSEWGFGILVFNSSGNRLHNNNICANDVWLDGIYLYQSSDNKISNNNVPNNRYAISLYLSSNNIVLNNTVNSSNCDGLWVHSSNNNILTNNTANSNKMAGICLYSSSNNKIYLNNFINNTDNVRSYNSTNIWNSTEKITYTYNGSEFENYLGNYWDDYVFAGNDTDGDGIGDIPYDIDSDADYYPLMEPFESYPAPTENIFDTGAPENPYPSIMGNHTGTITPNVTIKVSKLYTYPCIGTGGHTEYAMIWNKTIGECAVAEWNGYIGDYHNISFNKTLTLEEGVIYNYTIRTGSYPQIIHESPFNATGGEITCTKFTDANGKEYNDWIPAIKLFL